MYEPTLLQEDVAARVWWHLARATCRIANRLTPEVEELGITPPQFGVLRTLDEAGEAGLPLGRLSERLLVSCGNITGIVGRLERAGYLERQRSERDRRVVRARLTPAGRRLYRQALPRLREALAAALSGLCPRRQAALAELVRELDRSLWEPGEADATPPEPIRGWDDGNGSEEEAHE